jgi:hypothetical protein
MHPPHPHLTAFLRQVRKAVAEKRFWVTEYAREGATALDWDDWDVAEQLRCLSEADWLRCEDSLVHPEDVVWVFTPALWDEGFLWVRLVERAGIVVVSFHRG